VEETNVRSHRVTLRVLHPREELKGASLRFEPRRLRAWYQDGLSTAREVSARPDARSFEASIEARPRVPQATLGRRGRSGLSPT
jgi:hypothetical protein